MDAFAKCIQGGIDMKRLTVEDLLEKMQFFQGQRAGRELWNVKPKEVQEEDIENFNKDIENVRKYIRSLEKKIDADGCFGCAFEDVNEWELPCCKCKRGCKDYWRAKVVE